MTHLDSGITGLKEAAAQRHLLYGTAVSTFDLSDERSNAAILRECNAVTPEYEMKWDVIAADLEKPDYRASDKLIAFAAENGLAFHGHTLWWHGSIPAPLQESGTRRQFAEAALAHLTQTIRRYAGRLHSWDVVNEPLEPDDGRSDGFRHSRFLDAFGPGYIGQAFRTASVLDPDALLVLNEMGLEYACPKATRKRRQMLDLLERELGGGTPIACLGIQSHLDAVDQPRHHPEFRAFLREVDQMGLSVMITEMDVTDVNCPGDQIERDRMVADLYRAYLDLVLEECRVVGVSTWCLSDDRTWLEAFQPRADGEGLRPLPLDCGLQRKPAWHALKAALESSSYG